MAGLGSEHMGSGVEGGQWGSKTGCPSVGEQERGGGCSCIPATGQRRGQKGGVCPSFLEDCAIGTWVETPGPGAAPLLILGLARQRREEGAEGEPQSAQTSRQTVLSHCGGRGSPGLRVSWLGLHSWPWIDQTCKLLPSCAWRRSGLCTLSLPCPAWPGEPDAPGFCPSFCPRHCKTLNLPVPLFLLICKRRTTKTTSCLRLKCSEQCPAHSKCLNRCRL